jgi:hypothetical protein
MVIKVKYNGEWVKIPYLSSDHSQELVEEAPKDGSQYARQNGVWSVVNIPEVDFTEVYNTIATKVDKVEGKGLSTNDYVTADKTKVTNINEVIEAATKNITATDISITLDKRNLVTNVVENIELNLPASTTALAGLMLPADKIKLNGIAAGAEVNVNADWNATEGDALILNKPTLATVATSGSYNDLTEKPTIPTVDVNKEYVDTQLATKSDLPDYTVFDIFMNIMNSSDTPSISQENYNTLLSKLENNNISIFPVRSNYAYIISLYGANSDGVLTLKTKQEVEIGNVTNIVLKIEPDLTYSLNINSTIIDVASNAGIRIQVSQSLGEETHNENINLHTTGDGTKSLMDDGKYHKLPVYGKNLLHRTHSDKIPSTIERDSNGYYLYRWDIQTEQRNEYIGYSYYEVTVWPTLTANKILETCINELWGTDVEAKKLNDYNAALLGILDESYINIYKDFLQKRKQLKEQVDSDFVAYEQIQEELNSGQITAIT